MLLYPPSLCGIGSNRDMQSEKRSLSEHWQKHLLPKAFSMQIGSTCIKKSRITINVFALPSPGSSDVLSSSSLVSGARSCMAVQVWHCSRSICTGRRFEW